MKEIRPMKVTNNFYNYYFKSNITLKKMFNLQKHNTLSKTTKQINSKKLLPLVLLPIIAYSNPIPTNVNNYYYGELEKLEKLLSNGEISQKEFNDRVKDLKKWFKSAQNAASEKAASSHDINKTSPEYSKKRRYKEDEPEKEDVNFEGSDSTSIEEDDIENTNFFSRTTHWIKEKLHISKSDDLSTITDGDSSNAGNIFSKAIGWIKGKLHNSTIFTITEPNISDTGIGTNDNFVDILNNDDLLPKTLDTFVELSDDIGDIADSALDVIADNLDNYDGILRIAKTAIEEITNL